MNNFSATAISALRGLNTLAICAGVCCVTMLAANVCSAQDAAVQFKTIPLKQKFRDIDLSTLSGDARRAAAKKNSEARRNRNEGKTKARDGIGGGNIEAAKDFLNGYVYPQMTQPDQLAEAGSMRDSFFRTYLGADVSQQARQQFISSSVLPAMETIANGKDYYPAARLNAVAVIGRLDDRPLARGGSGATPPIPSAAAFKFLTGTLNNATTPPYLKAAAMNGITRHLKVDRAAQGRLLDAGARNLLTSFALNTIQGKTPGQDKWKPELDYWLKRRSVQLIGEVGVPGPGGQFVDLLVKIAGDDSQNLWMQFDAVKSLRTMNLTGLPGAKASEVVLAVTDFLQRSLDQESARIEGLLDGLIYQNILYGDTDFEISGTQYKKNIGKSGGSIGRMMGGSFSDDDDDEDRRMSASMSGGSNRKSEEPAVLVELPNYHLNLARRRMKILAFTCNDVLNNAQGLAQATGPKEKQLISDLAKFNTRFMKDSNVGIVNLDDFEEKEPQQVSFTEQLQTVCNTAAISLKNMIASYKGNGNNGLDAPGPVEDEADPLNGLGG